LAWKTIADRLGIPFDETINQRLRGVSRMESLEIILEKSAVQYTKAEKVAFAKEKNAVYCEYLMGMTPADLKQDVSDTISILRRRGFKMSIGSSSRNAKTILLQIGLSDFFDAISDGTNISNSKPDPEVFLKAAAFLNLPPEQCEVVEDAKAGIEAAKSAGCTAVFISKDEKEDIGDYRIDTFRKLLEIL
jgi:beta-phosphoglucomutase